MKASKTSAARGQTIPARRALKSCLAAMLIVCLGISWNAAICRAQQPDADAPGTQVLTRGPVHEAFAGIVTFNPEPGVMVTKAPPEIIEEMPPEERPEGDNITWIPGYWGWDDERSDFLWVSGTWRALPPGREWMAGYWGKTAQGYQWTSGYWADATAKETTYLPAPPATVESGPNIAAPSVDYGWTPGCWVWYQGRYAWRPGYWVQGRADWSWCPAHYVWTPHGYIFVGGFWDYPVERRGILFAPVYFEAGIYSRHGYSYSPSIVIDLNVFSDHLFLRPRYSHYYFGDYYASSYVQGGFYASFSFQSGRYGYDPIYSHQRWEHRGDREWEHRVQTSYQNRRDHETERPPRTWAAQRTINSGPADSRPNRALAAPMNQLAKRTDNPTRFQPVAKAERQQLAQRGQEVQKSREQRRTLEAKPADASSRRPGGVSEPAKVQLPRSPIVAKSANQLGKDQAPPKAQQAPKPNPRVQPRPEPSARTPSVERSTPQTQPRQPEAERKPAPGRTEAPPREKQPAPKPERRPDEGRIQTPAVPEKPAPAVARQAPPEPDRRAQEAAAKSAETSKRNAQAAAARAQAESKPRPPEPTVKAREDSERNARSAEMKARQESEQRGRDSARNVREVPQRNPGGVEKQPQRVSQPTTRQRSEPTEKGAARLLRNDRQQQGKDKENP